MQTRLLQSPPTASIALVAALLSAGCQTPAASPPSKFDSVRAQIHALVESGEIKSASVGVIEDGKIVWADSFGYADAEKRGAATIRTPYGVASMGKALTATAAMTLVQSGRLDLDSSAADILGAGAIRIYAGSRAPTVRELLNMTSGVPHGALTFNRASPDDEQRVLANQSFVAFPAGTVLHYSNFSMALMERVIEKASGMSYDDYLAKAVFVPLGMKDARIGANAAGAATRYRADGSRFEPITPFPRSSRQISASLSDLMNFAAMFLMTPINQGASPLSAESIRSMLEEKSALPATPIALGLSSLDLEGGGRMIVSSGNDMGVQSSMFLLPDARVGAVILSNSSGFQTDELALSILDAASPGASEKFAALAAAFEERTKPFERSGAWLGRWTGAVAGPDRAIPVVLDIGAAGVRLRIDGADWRDVEDATLRDGVLTGATEGFLALYETPEGLHRIELSLVAEGDRLVGYILADFRSARGKFEIPAALAFSREY